MQYKEVKKPAMKFIGIGVDTSVQKASRDCPRVWQEFMKKYKDIKNYIGGMKNYGVCINPNERECTFRYVACAEVSDFEEVPEGMEKVEIPAENCFVFIHKGKLDKLGETYGVIMKIILETKKKQKGEFWIEFYDYRWKGDKDESEFEIWIPVE
ncbi:GyrI-like domain-containing protein [Candidatus Woesearchaeota archaeon]|nr:GyrI-like domain-containing protein [Candidatus Woesearchaeota archaeon]